MNLLKGKHLTKDIDGVRCSVVEDGITKERVEFLKEILEFNGYEVHVEEKPAAEEGAESTYIMGVNRMLLTPVIAVYQRLSKTKDDRRITPDFWNQKTTVTEPNYWDRSKKNS